MPAPSRNLPFSPPRSCPMSLQALFHPALAAWFDRSFNAPTPAQAQAWPAIQAGRHTLIAAPTGSGKTLAAFLAAIDSLLRQGLAGELGNETQVHIEVTATAECINRGGHNPNAGNKTSVSAAGDFPIQNGKALFSLDLEATFSPSCSPPMSIEFTDIEACDTEHGVCCTL